MSKTYVIAEIGACHDGQKARMYEAIDEAKSAGASAIKFQWVSDAQKMAARRGRAAADGYADIYRRYLQWPIEWHADLLAHCAARGVDYLCTAYLPEDVAVVGEYVRHFKIASFEAEDAALWQAHGAWYAARPSSVQRVFVSHGMGAGRPMTVSPPVSTSRITSLLCVSAYPAPVASLNLCRLRDPFDYVVGLSDHTDPALTWTGALAVAAGAEVIEAHMRLDATSTENPDRPHAMSPSQFREYARHIVFAEDCFGRQGARMQSVEQLMARYRVRSDHGN